ncbi:MAG TPA: hypothetical protein VEQ87_13915 [Burkholderiales bacterium]|nr:hypothetical protein [Burkholderiales bacterium]
MSLEVPAGQSKSVRLRNLPSGTVLQVAIKSSGRLLVALVSAKQLKSPEGKPEPVFRGALDRSLSFKVVVPETSDYFLVLNNVRGSETLSVQTAIRAERAAQRKPAPAPREKMQGA